MTLSITKPVVGGSNNQRGGIINTALDNIVTEINSNADGTNQVVVNIGDMMSRLTNDKLHSSIHQVINPPKSEWHKPRFSIPFFMHPRSEMSLNCLQNCIDKKNPKKYTDISAGAFLEERIKELGLKK